MTRSSKSYLRILPAVQKVYRVVKRSGVLAAAVRKLRSGGLGILNQVPGLTIRQRANRAAAADLDWTDGILGAGAGWARTEYGEYYATSVTGTQSLATT